MESIQLAQMLADLSDLNAAQEASAAVALVNANKPAATALPDASQSENPARPPIRPDQRHHNRTGSAGSIGSASTSFLSRTASPAKFDKYGRRILTPPNTRANSSYGSIPGTPRHRDEHSCEDDVDRAGSLMALYEIRAKLKDQDNRSLLKLRDKIAAIQQARQQQEKKESTPSSAAAAGGESSRSKYIYPKSS
ncbi:hypothetical protein QBC35DRAFT_503434 [Podospora australis]|uniref:Uncharacterized protein n=1 Tax=Podospora australis TaxID=1536484 RepID=A0AAN7AGX3_9PEZI|nr:hypothetical protein QBC35DRAFT_503434 [Podospora australis]